MGFFEKLSQVESLAFKIISDLKITKPPINVKSVAQKMGLEVVSSKLSDEVSGILVISNNKGTIAFNPKDKEPRQRFTIAHELGHFLLHKSSSQLFVDKDFLVKYRNSTNTYTPAELRQESEANAFAAALLMPKHFIKELLDKPEFQKLQEPQLIAKLAGIFKVSVPAMTFRLSNLNVNA